MKLNVAFSETNQSFNAAFGELQTASDGGYDRGYLDGAVAVANGSLEALSSDELTSVRMYAFHGSQLKHVDLPNVTAVEQYAFRNSALETVRMASLTKAGAYAFRNCVKLSEFYAPNLLTVENYGIGDCYALQKLVLPSFTGCANGGFYQCTKLQIADLGNAKNISAQAFAYCNHLETLVLRGEQICKLASNSLTSTQIAAKKGYVYVPRSLVDGYKAAANWSAVATQFRTLEDYTVDGTTAGELDPDKI